MGAGIFSSTTFLGARGSLPSTAGIQDRGRLSAWSVGQGSKNQQGKNVSRTSPTPRRASQLVLGSHFNSMGGELRWSETFLGANGALPSAKELQDRRRLSAW